MTPQPARSANPVSDSPTADHLAGRREFLRDLSKYAAALIAAPLVASRLHAGSSAPAAHSDSSGTSAVAPVAVMVYKDKSCGCCKEWVKHMQKAGFAVTSEDAADMDAIKKKLGVPAAMASCHTAVIGDYLVEGHVPADVVQIMLKEKPAARGLAVPGMPAGSPGMEGPVKEKYNVMLFERTGKARVYASR